MQAHPSRSGKLWFQLKEILFMTKAGNRLPLSMPSIYTTVSIPKSKTGKHHADGDNDIAGNSYINSKHPLKNQEPSDNNQQPVGHDA